MERGQTNKAWAFGRDRFKQRIQDQLGGEMGQKPKEGTENLNCLIQIEPYLWARLHHRPSRVGSYHFRSEQKLKLMNVLSRRLISLGAVLI